MAASTSAGPDVYYLSSIWMSGNGPAADPAGNVYVQTGNSDALRASNYPDSVVKYSSSLATVADYFTPANYATLDIYDLDLGSAGLLVVPDQYVGNQSLAVGGSKDGRLFLYNRNNLGKFSASGADVPSSLWTGQCWCSPAFFQGEDGRPRILSTGGTQLQTLLLPTVAGGALTREAAGQVIPTDQDPGMQATVSSNGAQSGSTVLWTVPHASGGIVSLLATSPKSVATPTIAYDRLGLAWSFGAAVDQNGSQILQNGLEPTYTRGVQIVIDAYGAMWHQNAAGPWYTWTGNGAWTAMGATAPNTFKTAQPGAAITPASGGSLIDNQGNTWSFAAAAGSTGNQLLLNGVATAAYGVRLVADTEGNVWHQNNAGAWYAFNGFGVAFNAHGAAAPATATQAWTPGASLTIPTGGALEDSHGNRWSFGPITDGTNAKVLLNGVELPRRARRQDRHRSDRHHVARQRRQESVFLQQRRRLELRRRHRPPGHPPLHRRREHHARHRRRHHRRPRQHLVVRHPDRVDGTQILMNGNANLFGRAAKIVIDARGVMWHQNTQGYWYAYDTVWWIQHTTGPGPAFAPPSTPGTVVAPAGILPTLANVQAGVWPNGSTNANIVPVVANGKVYVASYKLLTIWGLAN